MKFSILRLLIATGIVAIWLAITKALVTSTHGGGHVDDPVFIAISAFLGIVACLAVLGLLAGLWALSGEIERLLKGDCSSWRNDEDETETESDEAA